MRRTTWFFGSLIFLFLAVVSIAPPKAHAFDPFSQVRGSCKSTADNAVCSSSASGKDPLTGTKGILDGVAKLLAIVGGAAAVVLIMINGIRFVLSNGDPAKVSSARDGIIYSIIGLVVIILARSIIAFVINRIG